MRRPHPPFAELSSEAQALYDAVNNERDLPCVLIAVSFLDQCLASLLSQYFIAHPISTSLVNGSLGRMRTRAELAFALGLIPESLHKNLLIVAEIRNAFAHSYLSRTFEGPEIARLCLSLSYPKVEHVRVDGQSGEVSHPDDPWGPFRSPRTQFTIVAVMMAQRLMLYGLGTVRQTQQERGWS